MSKRTNTAKLSSLRIIGGQYRSRLITFSEETGLRPTHSRVRETLFNWLNPVIENTTCLDVFAGSGALGFEALSRGAKHVTFLDISKKVIAQLKENASALKADNADFHQCDFTVENKVQNKKFDIVFCDPPFDKNILLPTCALLAARDLLNTNAHIYLEFKKNSVDLTQLPQQWIVKKQQSTQTLEYVLCQKMDS